MRISDWYSPRTGWYNIWDLSVDGFEMSSPCFVYRYARVCTKNLKSVPPVLCIFCKKTRRLRNSVKVHLAGWVLFVLIHSDILWTRL